ncbi:MAG: kinase/pyrophosphorylase [Alicyclobacillus sp.]|nr:kinase/pyrophosphorylase [Alicyclobacillus sp.]
MSQGPKVYVVSDSVGETAEVVVRAAASQFNGGRVNIRRVAHVGSYAAVEEAVRQAQADQAVIAFTLVLPELRNYLMELAERGGVPCVDVLGPMLDALEHVVGSPPHRKAGLAHQLDENYFRRVEAVEFAVKYDDGRDPQGLAAADVVLVGVSRTSKTPLSMYLAHRQVKVANVPLVPEVPPPRELFHLADPRKVIGLSIRPEKLHRVRQERLKALGLTAEASYASLERIVAELEFAHDVMKRLRCPVIDVSDRAVEETAGIILDYIARRGTTE